MKVIGDIVIFNNYSLKDRISAFALHRLVNYSVWDNQVNICHNPFYYPIFSALWLYIILGKEKTKKLIED